MKVKLYQDYEKLIRIKDVPLETEVSLRTAARQESIQFSKFIFKTGYKH